MAKAKVKASSRPPVFEEIIAGFVKALREDGDIPQDLPDRVEQFFAAGQTVNPANVEAALFDGEADAEN